VLTGLAGRALVAVALLMGGCQREEDNCSALDASGLPRAASARGAAGSPCAEEKDCPRSCLCRDLGRCVRAEGGACVVGRQEDCRRSRICTRFGQCSMEGGICVAASDADCRDAATCQRSGRCKARDGICVAP
jgi:hypothetical protein